MAPLLAAAAAAVAVLCGVLNWMLCYSGEVAVVRSAQGGARPALPPSLSSHVARFYH